MKTKEQILDDGFDKAGIRMGWIPESKQTVLDAMQEYADQFSLPVEPPVMQKPADKWISPKEREPDIDEEVIVVYKDFVEKKNELKLIKWDKCWANNQHILGWLPTSILPKW